MDVIDLAGPVRAGTLGQGWGSWCCSKAHTGGGWRLDCMVGLTGSETIGENRRVGGSVAEHSIQLSRFVMGFVHGSYSKIAGLGTWLTQQSARDDGASDFTFGCVYLPKYKYKLVRVSFGLWSMEVLELGR